MKTLEQEIIERQAQQIGQLTTNVMELDIRLVQALQTVHALTQEKEATANGDITEEPTVPNAEGISNSDSERVQQG